MRQTLLIPTCSLLILFLLIGSPHPSSCLSVKHRLLKTAIKLSSPHRKISTPSSNDEVAETTYQVMKHISGSNIIGTAEKYIKDRMPYYPILDLALQVSGYGPTSPTLYVMRKRFNRLKGTVYMRNMMKKYHIYRRTGQATTSKSKFKKGLKLINTAAKVLTLTKKLQSFSSSS